MGLREEHADALVEETVAEYEGLLSTEMRAALRSLLSNAFHVHPAMSELVAEHAPREHTDVSGTQPVDEGEVGEPERKDGHG